MENANGTFFCLFRLGTNLIRCWLLVRFEGSMNITFWSPIHENLTEFLLLFVVIGITITARLGMHWRLTCWIILNILSRMLPLDSKLQFGCGWTQWRSHSLHPMMSLLAIGSLPRTTPCPKGFLVSAQPWIFSTAIPSVGRAILTPWTTLSLITNITSIWWVSVVMSLGLMTHLHVPSRSRLIQLTSPQLHLLEILSTTMASKHQEFPLAQVRIKTSLYNYLKCAVN